MTGPNQLGLAGIGLREFPGMVGGGISMGGGDAGEAKGGGGGISMGGRDAGEAKGGGRG